MWLVAAVAVPLVSLAAAPLGTLLGLSGPCYDFEPITSAIIAAYLAVPAGVVLSLAVLAARAVGMKGGMWIRAVLALYAVAAVGFAVDFSGMCK